MIRVLLMVLAAVAALADARAGEALPPDAIAAYAAGDYARAVRQGEEAASAPALAFAARALVAEAITRPDGVCVPCLERAEALARRAAILDPRLVEACLQEAVAMGFRGRAMGVAAARAAGLAERVRERLDTALALEPQNIWARASLGAWHLEIATHAGTLLAAVLYDAGPDTGLRLFRAALADAGDEAVLHYQFALALLALDPSAHAPEAERALRQAMQAPARDALAIFVQARATNLLQAMRDRPTSELKSMVARLQGYPAQP